MGETADGFERLTALDESNLRIEDASGLPMHIAALAIVEGGPWHDAQGRLRLERLRDHVARRTADRPRLHQLPRRSPSGHGAYVWTPAALDIAQHVRVAAVPAPGDEAALLETCARLNEPVLARSRPLWEIWVLTGLAGDRAGLLIRLHHAVADGLAALALLGGLFDPASPGGPAELADPGPGSAAAPGPVPDRVRGLQARGPAALARRLAPFVVQTGILLRHGPAPRLSLNRPVGARRRILLARADLARAKAVAHAHGGKVGDIVLSAAAGGAHRLLRERGELRAGLALRASVATSVREAGDGGAGNQVAVTPIPLDVAEPDPLRRLDLIVKASTAAKRRPPMLIRSRLTHAWMVRAMTRQRLVNLLVSDLPGPPAPLAFGGARVLELFQAGVVQGNITLAVGAISYAGALNLDVVADADHVPDLAVFAGGMTETLDTLKVAADR